ncbi:MAG: YigZ family protein [Clostridiales bacterium]|jgi:uncharacterized YigZ family protein|nr:YigZ family protein [Clostridiales bacterium]
MKRRIYKTARAEASAEIIEKKSRFLATVAPVSGEREALEFIGGVKKKYWDARHNCSAFRAGEPLRERSSDDGEPAGSAGAPILEALKREEAVNIAVVVTRYFGGVLLGVGGLKRAYAAACRAGLLAAGLAETRLAVQLEVTVPYAAADKIKRKIDIENYPCGDIIYKDDVTFRVWVNFEDESDAAEEFFEISAGTARISRGEEKYIQRDCQ